jgi:hypothetical protein
MIYEVQDVEILRGNSHLISASQKIHGGVEALITVAKGAFHTGGHIPDD